MLKDRVGIDKSRFPNKLRDLAYKLDQDYWGNLFSVLIDLSLETKSLNEKLKVLYTYITEKEIVQYGKLMDAEENFEKSDSFKKTEKNKTS